MSQQRCEPGISETQARNFIAWTKFRGDLGAIKNFQTELFTGHQHVSYTKLIFSLKLILS